PSYTKSVSWQHHRQSHRALSEHKTLSISWSHYLAPDTLNWESLEVGYSEFLQWALSGDLDTFYENVRWQQWREDVIKLSATEAFTFYPFLWVQSEEARTRKVISLTELWEMQYQMKETFTQ
ncbi:DUF2625 family protein, partial [Escherichia coli]|uniref:DUF2625 family protein n=1 Tax=Escherichia coli TaxID=562 RepID=UPI002076EF11